MNSDAGRRQARRKWGARYCGQRSRHGVHQVGGDIIRKDVGYINELASRVGCDSRRRGTGCKGGAAHGRQRSRGGGDAKSRYVIGAVVRGINKRRRGGGLAAATCDTKN